MSTSGEECSQNGNNGDPLHLHGSSLPDLSAAFGRRVDTEAIAVNRVASELLE